MTIAMDDNQFVGRAEQIDFPKQGIFGITAKTDTGADLSSVWASDIRETKDGLSFCLLGEGNEFYTGERLHFPKGDYDITRVANSFGHREIRYRVKLTVRVKGRLLSGTFTLANRSNKTYPILLGRRLLAGKFLVDVQQGSPLSAQEKAKRAALKKAIKSRKGEEDV